MERNYGSVKALSNTIVSISRFNRGEASRIFDEVRRTGVKVVLKNNAPSCVLVEPSRYDEMLEALEDYALFFEAERRMNKPDSGQTLPRQDVLDRLGVTPEDLEGVEVDVEG